MVKSNRKDIMWLTLILLAAFILRAYGLGFPTYHWDEKLDFNNVFSASHNHLAILTYANGGSLLPYMFMILWGLFLLLSGVMPTTHNLILFFIKNSTQLVLLARGLIVLFSVGSVAIVFFLGKRLYSRRVGWLAAIFLSGAFLHVAESHYARTHVLAAFFIVLVIYFCTKIIDKGLEKDYIFAGISMGLATSVDYSAILIFLPFFFAHGVYLYENGLLIKSLRSILNRSVLLSVDIAAITFFFVTPYAIINLRGFAGEVYFWISQITTQRWLVDPEGQSIWLFSITEHLRNGIGISLTVIGIAGMILSFIKHTRQDILLVIFPLTLFITLGKGGNFARYLIPILPFLVIFVARLLDEIFRALEKLQLNGWLQPLIAIMVVGFMVEPVVNSIRFDYWLTWPDTRRIATEWVTANIPSGSKIVVEGSGVLGPSVPTQNSDLEQSLAAQPEGSLGEVYIQTLLETRKTDEGYRVLTISRLDQNNENNNSSVNIDSVLYYYDQGFDYLITSSWVQRSTSDSYPATFSATLNKYYKPIMVFEPTIYFRFDPYAWRIDYQALEKVIPGRQGIGGPRLTIYKRR